VDPASPSRARTVGICGALFVASLLLRLPGLSQGLWFDEVWMLVDFVRRPLGTVVASYPTDNHHPLYTLLAWGCARLFGEHAWTLRLPALLFGAASVPALYLFARRVAPGPRAERAALFASALLAASPHHVLFSQNARGYTAMLFFALAASEAALARKPVRQGIALALSAYAHLTGAFVALGHVGAWMLARGRDRSASRAPLAGAAIGGLLALALHAPMLPDMARFFLGRENPFAAQAEWTSPLWTIAEAARSLGFGLVPGLLALAAGAAVAALGVASLWRRDREAAAIAVLPAAACGLVLLAMGRNLWPRSFFFAAGFGALVAAEGFLAIADRLLPRIADALAAAAVVASLALLPRVWNVPKQDFAAARDFALSARAAGEPVLTVGLASFPYEAYYGGGFTPVDTREALERELEAGREALVITTFPIYLRSRRPEIARVLDERGEEIGRFRGSVGDGDVVVLRLR
jgi:4-amino-4-deoxy-L-arabinose transferase-like glycosyltransferase